MANTRPDQDQLNIDNTDKYLESTEDSGFFSNTNSTTFSCSSEIYFNPLSESKISDKNTVSGLSDDMTQLSLECTDCLNENSDFTEEKAYQELWELCFAQDENTGDTLLHAAIIQNCLEATLKIISVAPHPCLFDILNDYNQTALHLAVMTNQPKVVRSLVQAGADPSIRSSHDGNTALHLASISGNLECAKALTESMVTCRDHSRSSNLLQILEQRNYNGETCLHLAASKDNVEIVKLLVNLGADLEAQEYLGGRRVLHLALEYGSLQTVLYLIQECQPNLDLDATTYSGCTPLQIANFIDENIAYELIKLGATPQADSEDEGFYTGELKEMSGFVEPSVTYRPSVVSL